jgi:hypothetical protein
MATYYVASAAHGGSDSNAGTIGSPFLTVGHAQTLAIQGDVINGNGGDSTSENVAFAVGVTIQSYGTGQYTIAGANTSSTLLFNNCSGINIQNVVVTNADAAGLGSACVDIFASDGAAHNLGVTVNGCTLTGGAEGYLARVRTNNFGFIGNQTITNTTVSGQTNRSIWTSPPVNPSYNYSNVNVQNCVVSGCSGIGSTPGVGIELSGCDNTIANNFIQGCTVSNIGSSGAHVGSAGPAGMFPYISKYVIMQNNVVFNVFTGSGGSFADGIGIDIDFFNQNCSIVNNFIYGCQGPAITFFPAAVAGSGSKHVIANNLCINNCTAGGDACHVGMIGSDACDFVNNTVIGSSAFPAFLIDIAANAASKRVLNNIFITPAGIPAMSLPSTITGLTLDGNYYQSGDGLFAAKLGGTTQTSIAAWQTATGQEPSGIGGGHCYFVQPQPPPPLTASTLAGAAVYAPIAGAPVLNAGANLFGTYGITPRPDFLGNPWTQNSIGAIYNAGSTTGFMGAVYADTPMAGWRLGETAGTSFYDSVANFETGVFSGVTLNQSPLLPGDGGASVLYHSATPSAGTIASLPHTYALTALTIEATITPASVTGVNGIFICYNLADNRGRVLLFLNGTTLTAFFRDGGVGVTATYPGVVFAIGTTYHIVVGWSGTTQTCCINRVSQTPTYSNATALAAGLTLGTEIAIGSSVTSGSPSSVFNGNIGPIWMYPSALSLARMQAHYDAANTVTYRLTGPSGASVNTASANFTVAPTGTPTDTITITSSVAGDTITPSTLSWTATSTPKTFTVTGHTRAARTITLTSSGSLTVGGSPATLTVTVPFTISGPASALAGTASTVTVTPAAATTDVVTLFDSGGGTFVPPTLTFTSSAVAQTSAWTPAIYGQSTIYGTSTQIASFTPLLSNVYNAIVDGYNPKWGQNAYFVANSAIKGGNNNYVPALITAVNATPTIFVNGHAVQLGPVHFVGPPFSSIDLPQTYQQFICYPMLCGSVLSVSMSNAGNTSYTAPTITASGGGASRQATFGAAALASGLLSYAKTANGSGYTTSFQATVAGGSPSVPATVWVKVVSGVVTSIVPLTGSASSYGVGYSGATLTGIALNGGGGTGLVVTGTIGNYIQSVPITDPGLGYTSPPTLTITDSTGTGAVASVTMAGPAATDVLTYTVADRWLSVTINGVIGAVGGATAGPMANWLGQLEGPGVRSLGFRGTPTMAAGGSVGQSCSYFAYHVYFPGKNKLKAANPWNGGYATTSVALDANFYPQYWDPGGQVSCSFYTSGGSGGPPIAQYRGTWALQYDDDLAATGQPTFVSLSTTSVILPVNGPFTALPTVGTVTIGGGAFAGQITGITLATGGSGLQGVLVLISGGGGTGATYVGNVSGGVLQSPLIKVNGGQSYTSTPTVTLTPIAVSGNTVTQLYSTNSTPNLGVLYTLILNIATVDGKQHITNPWAFAPGNTIDRTKPHAVDDNLIANLTANGNGPGVLRFMDSAGDPACTGVQDVSDMLSPNVFSYSYYPHFNGQYLAGAPNSAVFAGTCSTSSAIVTGIPDTSILLAGDSIIGTGIPGGTNIDAPTKIVSVDSSSQITLSKVPKAAGVQQLSVNPTPSGTSFFSFARFWNTNAASTTYKLIDGTTNYSSPRVYSSDNWAISGTDAHGTYLDITHGPNGVNDSGQFIGGTSPTHGGGIVELRSVRPHGLKTGQAAFFSAGLSFAGTTTSGSPTVTGMTTGGITVFAGLTITGTGIPSGTTVASVIGPTSITLSNNATASGAVTLTATVTFNWSSSGVHALTSGQPIGSIWVTGPNTIAVIFPTGDGSGTGTSLQTLANTTEIAIHLPYFNATPISSLSYELSATFVGYWPNTAWHLNLPWSCSDAVMVKLGQIAATYCPNNTVLIELGNEPWNTAGAGIYQNIYEQVLSVMPAYLPSGTSLYPHFNAAGGSTSYVTNGAAIPQGWSGVGCIRLANKAYVFANAFAAAGGNAANVKVMYSGQYSTLTNFITSIVLAFNLPQHYICLAPYMDTNNAQSIAHMQPAGYAAATSTPDNWSVSAFNDLTRHHAFYGAEFYNYYAVLAAGMAGTTLQLIGYEGGMYNVIEPGKSPFQSLVDTDCFYHESFRDLIRGYFLGLQKGNINVAGSGYQYFSYFHLHKDFPEPLWGLADSVAQPIGSSLGNLFATPQGGMPANANPHGFLQGNVAPGMTGLNDWIGMMSPPLTPTPSPSAPSTRRPCRWFRGLGPPPRRFTR